MNRKLTYYFERTAKNPRMDNGCATEMEPPQACASTFHSSENTEQLVRVIPSYSVTLNNTTLILFGYFINNY